MDYTDGRVQQENVLVLSCISGVPEQVAEEHLHGVLVGFGQLLDQFLHFLNFVFGVFDFCSEKRQHHYFSVKA